MRKIKFRAYDMDEKVMRKWEEIHFTKDIGDDYYMVGYKASTACVKYDKEQILMQYTGFKDKKGTEIYEGDLCKVSAEEPYSNCYFVTDYDWKMIMYVDFEYGAFQLREVEDKYMSIYFIETDDMNIEVIGNIYENPEVRKQK